MNQFLNCINDIAIKNKYTLWYNKLIERGLNRNYVEGNIEKHHIFPVSFNTNWKYKKDNIVSLSVREHFICHLLLVKMFSGQQQIKMVSAIFLMKGRNVSKSSREYVKLKFLWSNHMKNKNPLFEEANKLKIKNALTGRTKETHDYIKRANIKKSQYNIKNSQWLKESRIKFKKTIDAMSEQERKDKFGHEFTDEAKLKLSLARRGTTKDNCERVRKMSETIKKNNNLLSDEEVKAKYSRTSGMRWYYSDNQKVSKLMLPINVTGDWQLGRKKYENKEN